MLAYIKTLLDEQMTWIGRCASHGNKDYWRAVAYGTYSTLTRLLSKLDDSEFPKIERFEQVNGDHIGNYVLFGESYKVSIDDYGQCFYIAVGNEDYSLGTYSFEVERDCVGLIFDYLYGQWLTKLDLSDEK